MAAVSRIRNLAGHPGWVALALIGLVFSGLLAGFEPVSGDPDRMYRPIKQELSEALRQGRLPVWTDRLGLGVPLLAESHVAALYPPNLVLYRVLDVNRAYRLAMFFHQLAIVAATYLYARSLGITAWGAALSGVAFTLCGFQAIHASHEPFYHALPYLPLSLWLTERYLATGKLGIAAALSLALGVQWTLGHYQIQTWTGLLVGLTALVRVIAMRDRRGRLAVVGMAILGGVMIAAVPLALSWEFAGRVGQTGRSVAERAFYAFPPAHWTEAVIPRLFRAIPGGPEAPYWYGQLTTGHEASFYVGTIPLILALVGFVDLGRGRPSTTFWRFVIPATLVLATMPAWWAEGYAIVLKLPGLGFFRAPARYTLITSFAVCLLAGQGLDRAISSARFRLGIGLAVLTLFAAIGFAWGWAHRPEHASALADPGLASRLGEAVVVWLIGLIVVGLWRSGRAGGWLPVVVTTVELGLLYFSSTVQWGTAIDLPRSSPILTELAATPGVGRIAGHLDNLPLRAGLTTAWPYTGFMLPQPQQFLKDLQEPIERGTALHARWFRRYGITHGVWPVEIPAGLGGPARVVPDPVLDAIVHTPSGRAERHDWRVVRFDHPVPEVRVAKTLVVVPDTKALVRHISTRDDLDEAIYLGDDCPPIPPGTRRATRARIVSWSGLSGVVEHDGLCDVILTRTYDPGWRVRINDGEELRVNRVEGGIQSVRLPGPGPSRITLRYEPTPLRSAICISVIAMASVGSVMLGSAVPLWKRVGSVIMKT